MNPDSQAPNNNGQQGQNDSGLQKLRAIDPKLLIAGSAIALLMLVAGVYTARSNSGGTLGGVVLGRDYAVDLDEVGEVDEVIENGFFYEPGPPPTDTTDYGTYELPEVSETLSARFIEVVNTSPAFADVDSIYELLSYDDFDFNGNIKADVMRDLIEIGESSLE